MENKRGGKREGAGRKRGLASITSEEARKYVISRIYEEIEPIISGQIELAKGIYYDKDKNGEKTRIYQRLPDAKVSEYLLNQLIGLHKASTLILERPVTIISEEEKAKINYILGIKD